MHVKVRKKSLGVGFRLKNTQLNINMKGDKSDIKPSSKEKNLRTRLTQCESSVNPNM